MSQSSELPIQHSNHFGPVGRKHNIPDVKISVGNTDFIRNFIAFEPVKDLVAVRHARNLAAVGELDDALSLLDQRPGLELTLEVVTRTIKARLAKETVLFRVRGVESSHGPHEGEPRLLALMFRELRQPRVSKHASFQEVHNVKLYLKRMRLG